MTFVFRVSDIFFSSESNGLSFNLENLFVYENDIVTCITRLQGLVDTCKDPVLIQKKHIGKPF